MVEYECIGNRTGKDYFSENITNLENIKIGNNNEKDSKNEEFLRSSNFEEMTSNVNCEEMKNKTQPLYTLVNLTNTISFKMEDIINQKSDNYIFDVNLNGKLSKELPKNTIDAKLELKGITDRKADCQFNIEENQKSKCKFKL